MKYSVAHFQTTFAEQWQADIFAQALCDIGFDTIDDTPLPCTASEEQDASRRCGLQAAPADNCQIVNSQIVKSLSAYIPTTQLDLPALHSLVAQTEGVSLLSVEDCPDENWNAVWESEHPAEQLPMGVVIVPHCAFGAGHHETTGMLIDALMERDWTGCRVLDNGCGTGVLGIFAAKRGAESVLAIDIDDKSVENTRENAARNSVAIEVQQGTLETLADGFGRRHLTGDAGGISECVPIHQCSQGGAVSRPHHWQQTECIPTRQGLNGQMVQSLPPFDLILSNIHRNILLSQLPLYARLGKEVWLSGFYEEDEQSLLAAAEELGLRMVGCYRRNGWSMLQLR